MSLPIRQNLDTLGGLNRTERAVLTQVVELAENGTKGYCDAKNETLGKRLRADTRTVSRCIARLRRCGLLVVGGNTSRRQITASRLLRPCYASETKAACEAATLALGEALSRDKMSLDKQGECLETNCALSIDKQGRAYKETRNEENLEEKDEKAKLRFALELAEKKIGELEAVVVQQAGLIAELKEWAGEEIPAAAGLVEQAQAPHTRAATDVGTHNTIPAAPLPAAAAPGQLRAYDPTAISPSLKLPFDTETFRTAWGQYRQYREEQKLPRLGGGMQEQEVLRELGNLAQGAEATAQKIILQTITRGWKALFKLDESRHDARPSIIRTNRLSTADPSQRNKIGNPSFAGDVA